MGRWLLITFGYIMVVVVNALANILPINGQNTGDIANRIEVLFTPAGYVFSIWGLIYILIAIWIIRQLPTQRRNLPVYISISNLFLITCLLNVGWILLWHYNFFLWSVPVMISLLITLILIYLRLKKEQAVILDRMAFSVYLGWISVATIANISYVLVEYEWSGWGISPVVWTIIMTTIATIVGTLFRIRENDRLFVLVFVWALLGIGVKQFNLNPEIVWVAWAEAIFLFIIALTPINYLQKMKK